MSKPDQTPEPPPDNRDAITDASRPVPRPEVSPKLPSADPALVTNLPEELPLTSAAPLVRPGGRSDPDLPVLRRRLARTRMLFWIFVALMPLGCAGPMALFALIPDRSIETGLFIAGLLLPFVGLGGMLLMWGDRRKYARSLAVAEQAERMGWRFTEKPPPERYYRLKQLQTFSHANNDLGVNLVEGEVAGFAAWAIDFTPDGGARSFLLGRPGTAVGTDNSVQTVLLLEGAAGGMPDFVVAPKRWTDRVGQLFGGWLITLPDYPEFNEQMALRGRDKEAVAARMTPELIALCLKEKDLTVEVQDGDLALHRRKKVLSPQRFAEVLEHAALLVEAFRAA